MKDSDLAARIIKKDENALGDIILKYTPLVSTIIYNVSKGGMTKEDIEEVTQDVFITLWKNSKKIQPDKLKGYICRIAKTRAINKLSSIKSNTILNIDDYDPEDNFDIADQTETKEINKELMEVVNSIGEPDKEILIRYYFYYQKTLKISEIMKLNLETVKTKLKRTREKIKIALIERGFEI